MNELALFAGAGGGILGGKLLGWRTVCAVEWEPYPASVLCARQNDGLLPPFPIWDDVQTFDGKPWRGIVDVISGGFPCQDISAAGKGEGIDGERSGMWKEMARIVSEVRPEYVYVENSPMLTSRGLGTVLGDLSTLGYDAEWGVVSAADIGANHLRERIWILSKISNPKCQRWTEGDNAKLEANKTIGPFSTIPFKPSAEGFNWDCWKAEPDVCRVVNGMAAGVDRLKAIGNGQVPQVAGVAFEILRRRLKHGNA
jgi:DNA (cytosine-5)-methyltransferase 1